MADAAKEHGIARRRLMALEIRPRRFGFVVLEGVSTLLDSGVRSYGGEAPSAVTIRKIADLMTFYQPVTVVMRRRRPASLPEVAAAPSRVMTMVRAEARRRLIDIRIVSTEQVRTFFAAHGGRTKHTIASTLADWFEELIWKLPPKRKPWQNERYNMLIFDAAATAMTLIGSE
jgi:hypothetical protein